MLGTMTMRGYTRKRKSPKTVLVVDDKNSFSRLMERAMRHSSFHVLSTSDITEVPQILENKSVTHLLCDEYFGPEKLSTYALIAAIRQKYPKLERVVLFSETRSNHIAKPGFVDATVSKTSEIGALIEALTGVPYPETQF